MAIVIDTTLTKTIKQQVSKSSKVLISNAKRTEDVMREI
jgi:hypothetical protein